MAAATAVGLIVLAIGIGILAYGYVGGASHTLSDASALASSVLYLGAGIALVVGGFTVIGLLFVAGSVFIGLGKADRFTDTDLRRKING